MVLTKEEQVVIEHNVASEDPDYLKKQKHGDAVLEPNMAYQVTVDREATPGDMSEGGWRKVVD
jgi:ABC-type uncharacterized transport system YnjBCD substrate-binding protein